MFSKYVDQVCSEIVASDSIAAALGGELDPLVDSIYLGGGTPSVLTPEHLKRLFQAVRNTFEVDQSAEITVECAPGTISKDVIETLVQCGVNRVSLGVQSFVDQECSAVGRLHTRQITLDDIARLRAAGVGNIGVDLIAGLPHQGEQSWEFSLNQTLATAVPHVSVYMLEVDEDSRLGNEVLAGGNRYHAHFVPNDDLIADLYLAACERLEQGGVRQYEISNFARPVTNGIGLWSSPHNLKYWTRQPYLGFGVDAHSMLLADDDLRYRGLEAVRFAKPDSLETYSRAGGAVAERVCQLRSSRTLVDARAALEESFFLGLRQNRGISLAELKEQFGDEAVNAHHSVIAELVGDGLLEEHSQRLRLTPRGRLLSNEVFGRFLLEDTDPEDQNRRAIPVKLKL